MPTRLRSTAPPSTAEELFIGLCRAHPPQEDVRPEWSLGGVANLRSLEALAIRHGVEGLVYSRLVGLLSEVDAPADVRKEAEAGLSRLRRQTAFRDMEQDRVLNGLAREGFHPLVLKGGALRRTVFSPLERTMGDLDILVARDEVDPVLATLGDLGYRSQYPDAAREQFRDHHHEEQVAHPAGFLVEVHWGLTRPGHLIQLDPARFRERAVVLDGPGSSPIRIPCAEDMLVHTVSQSEQESVQGFRRVVDLDRIARTPGLDWDDVRRHAGDAGLHGALCVALRLANLLLDTAVPDDLLTGRNLSPSSRRVVAALDPVRRLLDEPGRMEAVEFQLFRLWCMHPDHRSAWLRHCFAGRTDPLHWAWEGREDPDAGATEGTTGILFLLKLASYQAILSAKMFRTRLRDRTMSGSDFWLDPESTSPQLHPGRTPP